MAPISDRTLQRRLDQVNNGQRDALRDYQKACEAVRTAHTAWNQSKAQKKAPSASLQDRYAAALTELDLCTRILEIVKAQAA